MTFSPTLDSIKSHQLPQWYDDAKFGIFIHWGLYSVPGYAPLAGDIGKIIQEIGWQEWFRNNSYAEWYLNTLKFDDSPTRDYHNRTYGADFVYDDLVPHFNEAIQRWNPDSWADLFQRVGARYVVLTTKHHDGFNLWPTQHPCPRKPGYQAARDLVGELTQAVRAKGLRMGLFYSGGLDWSFNEARIEDLGSVFSTIVQEPEFVAYSLAHWRELIDRYQPALMWNDIGYPSAANLLELFADYYNAVPDGVINNRFTQFRAEQATLSPEEITQGYNPHYDFITPEYQQFDDIQTQKWETCRGIGHSFGYNRAEGDEQLIGETELVHMLVDIVSKNGNLLLNVGPMADGTIPENQQKRLETLGAWLAVNGEAIFGTRPWTVAASKTSDGLDVRFTRSGDAIYATLLGTPAATEITITGLQSTGDTQAQLVGGAALAVQQTADGLRVTLPDTLPAAPAHSLKLTSVSPAV